ncbi:SRPBCC family protein [Devosia sediminis]|uniref:SRPBCC family protein n=1 Tax=Devosia sediminis TaxID=2798801 RepID=A0A934MQ46_9HYPH|nr:SRPBCC family protein [Devosia sediminis]MBJ3783994.1 SRPBCC family protein [Devosia sediminis]
MPTYHSRTLSVTIARPWKEVYAFAADPANMAEWAAGLGGDFEPAPDGDGWIANQDGTAIRITFTPPNDFGVLDHDVHTPGGVVHVALRVVPNGSGAEVTFLLLQERAMSDAELERDAAAVQKDLDTLKRLMEDAPR